jgi:hypothetical protein
MLPRTLFIVLKIACLTHHELQHHLEFMNLVGSLQELLNLWQKAMPLLKL